mgnify:FL=1
MLREAKFVIDKSAQPDVPCGSFEIINEKQYNLSATVTSEH